MTFRIHHCVPYYSQSAHQIVPRSQDEWDAYKFCGAVKSRSITGYCTVPNNVRIDTQNVGRARQVFGQLVSSIMKREGLTECWIVPVPSKDSFDTPEFRSLAMIRESLPTYGRLLLPIVKFNKALPKASQGGDRGYHSVYPHLSVRPTQQRDVVLVDDILTSGGTLLATRRRLLEAGHNIRAGIVCGRTTHDKIPQVFKQGYVDLADNATSVPFLEA